MGMVVMTRLEELVKEKQKEIRKALKKQKDFLNGRVKK